MATRVPPATIDVSLEYLRSLLVIAEEHARLSRALQQIMEDDETDSHPCDPPNHGYFGTLAKTALAGTTAVPKDQLGDLVLRTKELERSNIANWMRNGIVPSLGGGDWTMDDYRNMLAKAIEKGDTYAY